MPPKLKGPVSGADLSAQDKQRKKLKKEASGALRDKAATQMGLSSQIQADKASYGRASLEASRAGSRDIHAQGARGLGAAMGSGANSGMGANYAAARSQSAFSGEQSANYRAQQAERMSAKNLQYDQQAAAAQSAGYEAQASAAQFDVESMDDPQKQVAAHRAQIQSIFAKHSGFFDDDEESAAREIEALAAQETDQATREWLIQVAADVRTKQIDFGDTMSWVPGRYGQPVV